MLTVVGLLILIALALTIASAFTAKVPLWVAVLFLCIVELVTRWPGH